MAACEDQTQAIVGQARIETVVEHRDVVRDDPTFRRQLGALLPAGATTAEAIESPAAHDLHFGQMDHVRWYGRDFRDRVTAAGFQLEEYTAAPADCARHSLLKGETVFVATR